MARGGGATAPRAILPACVLVAAAALAVCAPAASALPRIAVETTRAIPDEPKVPARVRIAGAYRGRAGIEVRGHTSQRFPKKSYAVELRTRGGAGRDVSLLGMPADDDWVLHAPYNDKSLMRNVVAYAAARAMGRWAPRTRYAELWLNGDYRGVYVLAERPEIARGRARGDWMLELTFGFQARRKGPYFRTRITRQAMVWSDPGHEDLTRRERREVRARIDAAESALYRGGDWRAHFDEAAAIDYVLVQELMRNADAFRASTFLTLTREGRIRMGPVWDFDLSSGNHVTQRTERAKGWFTTPRRWVRHMWTDGRFRAAVRARWRELRRQGFRSDVLDALERSRRTLAGGPAARNFRRWPILDVRLWQNPVARGSFGAEVGALRRYLVRRMAWMDRAARRGG
jgi:hypothetical protein